MSEQPVIEVHYIKQGDELRSQYIDQDPAQDHVPMRIPKYHLSPQPSMIRPRQEPTSDFIVNGKLDRYTYQKNGTYTHIPYDSPAMQSGFKTYYDHTADIDGCYQFYCCYNNWNRCNNCWSCCNYGFSVPVYMAFVFVILFFLMLLLFIFLGLVGNRTIG